jgi:hypothetical protein
MDNKNYTIIEDIFDMEDSSNSKLNPQYFDTPMNRIETPQKQDIFRTLDSHSARPPYPVSEIGNMPSLSYDENMIKNKLSRQINPRSLATRQYNSMTNSNRILQYPEQQPIIETRYKNKNIVETNSNNAIISPNNAYINENVHIQNFNKMNCRDIYNHIDNCPICSKYYKQSNRTYIIIIIFLVLIILLLIRQKN